MASEGEGGNEDAIRAPIVEEVLHVEKRCARTGVVTVKSRVVTDDVAIREELTSTSVRVERVAVGRFVDAVPEIRTEGNLTIVPVVEEVLVKRLRLVEEVHLIREDHTHSFEEDVSLRRLDVTVERSVSDQT